MDYWKKLKVLRLYSQERRRERYVVIFLWKITQGLVSGYNTVLFTPSSCRTGRKAVPATVNRTSPAVVKSARERSLAVKGAMLFNCLPIHIRNSDHGDVAMFKNHLDLYLEGVLDQPTIQGLVRGVESNSLLHQIPLYEQTY